MNLTYHYHRHSNLVTEEAEFKEDYQELVNALETISDIDLVNGFLVRKEQRASIKSLSEPINFLIKDRLVKLGWNAESGLFKEAPYDKTNSSRWRLDFAKNSISVEVAFNHAEAIAHNIIKPVLASELNHVQKEIQTKLGIIVFEPDIHEKMIKTSESSLGIIHKTQWFEIPIDEDNFVSYVKKVVKLLSSQDIPHSAESCQFCDYRKNDF